MSIYYHISTNLLHDGKFEPRVPEYRYDEHEDAETPRICVSETIDGCFTAMPDGASNLYGTNMDRRGYFLLMKIDTEKLGIMEEDIISWKTLYKSDKVRDSNISYETWITKSFQVAKEDMQLIKLIDWEEYDRYVFPHAIHEIAEKEYDGDCELAFSRVYGGTLSEILKIAEAYYITPQVNEGKEISFPIGDELEWNAVVEKIDSIEEIEITKEFADEVTIRVNQSFDLTELFLIHAKEAGLIN